MKRIFTLTLLAVAFANVAAASPGFGQLRSNLYIVSPSGEPVLMDGTLTQYDSGYSNALDNMDARKMSNFSENWGMLRGTSTYVIERRKNIEGSDSIFFKMWNMRIITYRIELVAQNLAAPGRMGFLQDSYLGTETPVSLDGSSFINFSVSADANSKKSDRFRLIIRNAAAAGLLPLQFTNTNLQPGAHSHTVTFSTAHEQDIRDFSIERSGDGIQFNAISRISPYNNQNAHYSWTDEQPLSGNSYYRIASTSLDGKTMYSAVMKAFAPVVAGSLSVYPNPVKDQRINVRFSGMPAGQYAARLTNSFGQVFLNKTIDHNGGNQSQVLAAPSNIPKGIYRLEVVSPSGNRQVISVVF